MTRRVTLALILALCALFAGCGEQEKSLLQQAVVIKGNEGLETVYYHADELEPYSGWAKTLHDSGQLQSSGRLKDGNRVGPWTTWDESGQKLSEATYKDGKQHGLWRTWYENGRKEKEQSYRDGKKDGPYTWGYENGQKYAEGTYKDGKRHGPDKTWHENGQKRDEGTYKDGKRVFGKYWTSKGEEVETWQEARK